MRILELFSGTQSVGKVLKERGHTVLSLDLKEADINCNILDWDYKKYNINDFDYIHASPPCDTFSHCRKCNFGKPLKAHNPDWNIPNEQKIPFSKELFEKDQQTIGIPILNKTLEIIEYFKPKYFTIENPQTGDMKKYLNHLKHNDITYCKYGFDYRKITRVWHNFENWNPKPICSSKNLCDKIIKVNIEEQEHIHHLSACANKIKTNQNLKHIKNIQTIKGGCNSKRGRYRLPPELIKEWVDCMT